MSIEKKPKWDISATISAGSKTYTLTMKYRKELEPRLQPNEADELKSNCAELEARRSGQTESLVVQKSKTLSQAEVNNQLRSIIGGVRNIVKNTKSVTPDLLKAFGVGEKMNNTINSSVAAGNIIINGYKSHTAWSNSAGILEADITEIQDLVAKLTKAEEGKGNAMFTRKSKTMDKNMLQRAVEDEVSKISALGQHVFRHKDPSIAKLFEELIPAASKVKPEVQPEAKTVKEVKEASLQS